MREKSFGTNEEIPINLLRQGKSFGMDEGKKRDYVIIPSK